MMNKKERDKISKFLSLILRHKPETIRITLDNHGWTNLNQLIEKSNQYEPEYELTIKKIIEVVNTNEKKRFTISEDQLYIRASQGHSLNIDLKLKPSIPPEVLYHGTAERFLSKIMHEGLKPQERQYVHLSANPNTAIEVGKRYGKPILLKIQALLMHKDNHILYLAENGVWLAKAVPAQYIQN